MSRHSRAALLVAAALTAGLPGCGGGGGGNPAGPTVTQPPAPQRNTLPTLTYSGLDRGEVALFELSVSPSPAVVELTADWTHATDDIDIFVTSTSCSATSYNDVYNQRAGCASLARGTSVSKPERMTTGTLAAGNYRVWVGSSGLSSSRESGTLSITVIR
jgi:hypothetical protein